jgi:hypothetical protein
MAVTSGAAARRRYENVIVALKKSAASDFA